MCACGDDEGLFAEQKYAGSCLTPCSGDDMEKCGGDNDYDLFELTETAVTPVDTPTPSPVAVSPTTPYGKERFLWEKLILVLDLF